MHVYYYLMNDTLWLIDVYIDSKRVSIHVEEERNWNKFAGNLFLIFYIALKYL